MKSFFFSNPYSGKPPSNGEMKLQKRENEIIFFTNPYSGEPLIPGGFLFV